MLRKSEAMSQRGGQFLEVIGTSFMCSVHHTFLINPVWHGTGYFYPLLSLLKFGFSEKATKFEKIFVVLLRRASCSVRAIAYLSKS